jgi:hypothetical protein
LFTKKTIPAKSILRHTGIPAKPKADKAPSHSSIYPASVAGIYLEKKIKKYLHKTILSVTMGGITLWKQEIIW